MDFEFKLLDHFKLSNHLNRNFACSFSDDDRFFIITDVGIYILSLHGNVAYEFLDLCCTKHFLQVSDFAPCTNIDLDINTFHSELDKEDLYETLMGIEYSVKLKHAKPVDSAPLFAQWSPREIAGTDCMLAVLTNLHSLEIYMKFLDENEVTQYILISNLSQEIIDVEKEYWSSAVRFSVAIKLQEFKKRVHMVTPTVFRWSHIFQVNHENACAVFVGHINGDITAWLINHRSSDTREPSKLKCLGRYQTQLERLTTMYWHKTSDHGGALFFGGIDGRLSVLHITNLHQTKATFDKEQLFWSEADNVKIDEISVLVHEKETFLLAVKQRVLMVYGIDHKGDCFDFKSIYIEDYYITGLCHFRNKILVLSLPGILTQLTISVANSEISFEEKNIPMRNDMTKYRTHGCFLTKNRVLFCVLAYPWDLHSFSKSKKYANVFVYQNVSLNPFDLLWNNETNSLVNYWDCFETLRLICMKEKQFPWSGIPPDINYDDLPLIKLKTLRLIAKMSEMVFNLIPVVTNYEIKPFVILHYLVEIKLVIKRMKKLLSLLSSKKILTEFQMRSLCVQNFFLKEIVVRDILPKANVGKRFIEEIRSVMELANELQYPDMMRCVWCGEKILGPTCLPPHVDSRCSFSIMPILIMPAYKCPYCKCLAHKQIEKEEYPIICQYCDIYMERIQMRDKDLEGKYLNYNVDKLEEFKSECFDDCLEESIDLVDIEENETQYVVFTDSDDDEVENTSIRKLYQEFSKTSLAELLEK
ncbi:unnamed protein product [Phaedon cochleariae]|uniref:Transcription factor IIIC 90kDa subunit N-terminal domain-containing protein n=1 Tax=Phaedon cochleariae TaxID=80249 RepID=A0A9P0DN82_PHACE|nr:unnamed protein product [Phaedon cochleariae]